MYPIISGLVGLVVGAVAVWFFMSKKAAAEQVDLDKVREQADRIVAEAKAESEGLREKTALAEQQAMAEVERKADRELTKRKSEIDRTESRIRKREEQLEKLEEKLQRKVDGAAAKEEQAEAKVGELEKERLRMVEARADIARKAEVVSGMSAEQAKKMLLESLEDEVRQESAVIIRRVEAETKEHSEKKARQILTLAVQRLSSDHVSETTVSVVALPSDDIKGRIIGREGRNIRTLEQLTGVNLIVDDTPEAVVLSSFDPMRREIARRVLEALIADGRIHPGRIEELVQKIEHQVLESARDAAEQACIELGINDLHPELIKLMGRLKYRTSYGQNVLAHSVECGHIAEIISSELGLDARLAKRATFLHDIGKAVSHEMEGTHASIGANLAKKFRERPEVVHAIEAHHYEVEPKTLTAIIVITADAVSAARPGARRESIESYVKRLESLEAIANGFEGVEKSFAIQAGREVRIVVEPDRLNDDDCTLLARNVTKKIESDLQYPGQIKVTVLREVRKTEYAR